MSLGILPATLPPEMANALIAIDAVVFGVLLLCIGAPRIAAGSSRLAKVVGLAAFVERFKLWRAAHKND